MFKKVVLKQRLNDPKEYNDEALFTLALSLAAAAKKVFYEKSEMKFSAEPAVEKKLIIQFVDRMRVDGMEKFNNPTVFPPSIFLRAGLDRKKRQPPWRF